MLGELLKQSREIIQQITVGGGHQTDINLTSETETPVNVNTSGLVTFHNLDVDPNSGLDITGTQIHALLDTKDLVEKSYPIFRDGARPNEPNLLNDIIMFTDANGKEHTCRIVICRPSETFGSAVCFAELLS